MARCEPRGRGRQRAVLRWARPGPASARSSPPLAEPSGFVFPLGPGSGGRNSPTRSPCRTESEPRRQPKGKKANGACGSAGDFRNRRTPSLGSWLRQGDVPQLGTARLLPKELKLKMIWGPGGVFYKPARVANDASLRSPLEEFSVLRPTHSGKRTDPSERSPEAGCPASALGESSQQLQGLDAIILILYFRKLYTGNSTLLATHLLPSLGNSVPFKISEALHRSGLLAGTLNLQTPGFCS
ncbi:uncharacterized protein LOC125154015 [Prionailurus viverrinus]|uniref:uncharacterized protein LOC125154015 n=1 Tax=Prionailurus viverrinus TaxID=61388 RepID=UPI001FF48FFA|nr:uncharacterized protein LOC125154015 [Prionailurus viverrinus]